MGIKFISCAIYTVCPILIASGKYLEKYVSYEKNVSDESGREVFWGRLVFFLGGDAKKISNEINCLYKPTQDNGV